MDDAGESGLALGRGQHRRAGLGAAEHHAHAHLGDDEHDEGRTEQAAAGLPGTRSRPVSAAVGCSANHEPKAASTAAAQMSAPDGSAITASTPTSAGPSTKEASSAAPSYENAASSRRRRLSESRTTGPQRTRASGPICGIARPAKAATAMIVGAPRSRWVTSTTASSPTAPAIDCASTTGRWPMRSASPPANGAPSALATARAPAAAPPRAYRPVWVLTRMSVPSWLIASGMRPRKATTM